jgi:hypothetical protein
MRYPKLFPVFVLLACAALRADDWKPLWNGKDLSGWERWLGKPHASVALAGEAKDDKGNYTQPLGAERDPLNVFTVVSVDGRPAIHISGQIFGGITTKEEFSNYHLRLQFKWGTQKWPPREKDATPRDSGLLYHVHSAMNFNGKTWPRSPEFQIQEHDVGDLYAIGCQMTVLARRPDPAKRLFIYDPKGGPTEFIEQLPIGNRCIKDPDNEKPTGEWNTLDLVCLDDESLHIVNGQVVMRLTKATRLDGASPAPLTKGKILLQSEGAEIFYRAITLRPITAVPAEFAAK